MGMRVRLKADFNLSGFSPEATVILQALKKYGMILADNGSNFFISGTNDKRWDARCDRAIEARYRKGSRSDRHEGNGCRQAMNCAPRCG